LVKLRYTQIIVFVKYDLAETKVYGKHKMPTVHIEKGISFRFYSSDIGEPPHIHAVKGRQKAKIWLYDLSLDYNRGFTRSEIGNVLKITKRKQQLFLEAWNAFFS